MTMMMNKQAEVNDSVTKSCDILSCLFGIKMEDKEELLEIKKTFLNIPSKGNEVEIVESFFDCYTNRKARKFFLKRYDMVQVALEYTNHLNIHQAAQRGDLYSLKCFIKILKQDPNSISTTTNTNASTPLHEAALNGQAKCVQFLINSGSHLNEPNKDGSTPLHLACNESHYDVVVILLENNCKIDVRNKFGTTPMHYASRNRNKNIIRLLLRSK